MTVSSWLNFGSPAPPGRGLRGKFWLCLTTAIGGLCASVGGQEREAYRKTKIGTEVAHVTRDSDTTQFQGQKVKGQGHQAALLTAVLRRQAAASVSVRMYWLWERTAMFRSARWREVLRRPLGEDRGGEYCVATRTACLLCSRSSRMEA